MKVQLISGKHYRMEDGEQVRHVAGDVFDVPESELLALRDRLKPVEEPEPVKAQVAIQIQAEEGERPDDADPGEQILPDSTDLTIRFTQLFGEQIVDALRAAGIENLDQLATLASEPEKLAAVKGIGKARAGKIREELMAMQVPVEPAKGGYVEPNTVYLVGEGDPNVFTPKEP